MTLKSTHCMIGLMALSAPAAAATQMVCTTLEACTGTTCRDAAGMEVDFTLTYDAATAHVDFDDPTLPVTEILHYRGTHDGAPAYFFRQPDLMVAVQIFETETPPRARLAFGAPDAPETANQMFATCVEGAAP
jgi:hypothetical protein